ncbi:sensor histidine kinase [Flavitalea antarctica]
MTNETILRTQPTLQLLIESIHDQAIFMLDTSGVIITWNKGAEEIKGYASKDIIGKHFSVFYTEQQVLNGEPEKNLELARNYGRLVIENWRRRRDGSIFWAEIILTALIDDNAELIGYGKITRDITKRKTVEEEIRQLNTKFKAQLKQSYSEISDYKHALDEACIVAITDQKGIIKHVNKNFCKISGYTESELLGQDHRIINSTFHTKDFIKNLWQTIARGEIWRGELKNKAKNGTFYWVDTTIIPFLNEKGKPYQYLAIRSDITKRKLFEEEILKVNNDLEQKIEERTQALRQALQREIDLNEMKSRFVSLASHEFRTPLSAILSSTSLVERYSAPENQDKRQKHIDRIKSSVKNMTIILNDFLSVDKLEQGKIEIKPACFNLNLLIEDILEEVDLSLKKNNQTIIYTCPAIQDITQDKNILLNILLNLISNAIKYSQEGNMIYLHAEQNDRKIIISVKDTGIGIPETAQKELFQKFFRAQNVGYTQGTGLGLNIVKRYIELISGRIYFTSQENVGSTFTIEFPAAI